MDGVTIGVALALGMGLVGLLVPRLSRRRSRLVVTDRGILDRSLGLGWIRWDEIEGAYPAPLRERAGVFLRVRRPPGRERAPVTLRLDLEGSGLTPVELLQAVVTRGGRPRRRD